MIEILAVEKIKKVCNAISFRPRLSHAKKDHLKVCGNVNEISYGCPSSNIKPQGFFFIREEPYRSYIKILIT